MGHGAHTAMLIYRMKISAIRNPIPEPPPVMKATLSLREKTETLYRGPGSDFLDGPLAGLHAPNAGGTGATPGQETRPHTPQLRSSAAK